MGSSHGDVESAHGRRARPDLTRVTIGPVSIHGHQVTLRPPKWDDFAQWRRTRVRDQPFIEPFWVSSSLEWAARHTERRWIRECLADRRMARMGVGLPLVVEVDGRFAGQSELSVIDFDASTAEYGVWVDSEVAGQGVGGLVASMMFDFAIDELDLERIYLPISVSNKRASATARAGGLDREAVLTDYFDVGGRRADHELWTAHADKRPAGGFVAYWLGRIGEVVQSCAWERRGAGCDGMFRWRTGADTPRRRAIVWEAVRYRLGWVRGILHPYERGDIPRELLAEPLQLALRTVRHRAIRWPYHGESARVGNGFEMEVTVGGRRVGRCGIGDTEVTGNAYLWFELPESEVEVIVETIRLMVAYAFDVRGLRRVSVAGLGVEGEETALEQVGMRMEGMLHAHVDTIGRQGDHVLWGLTQGAWRTASAAQRPRW